MEIYTEEESTGTYEADSCLLFYNTGRSDSFVTANAIREGVIHPGSLMTTKDFTDLLRRNVAAGGEKSLTFEEMEKSWGLLFCSNSVKAWLSPPFKLEVKIQGWDRDDAGDIISDVPVIQRKTLNVPELIWVHAVSTRGKYFAHVFKPYGDFHPKDVKLSSPHFFNVYDTGKICWGTVTAPKYHFDVCETFWTSLFSHSLQDKPFTCRSTRIYGTDEDGEKTPLTLRDFIYDLIQRRLG